MRKFKRKRKLYKKVVLPLATSAIAATTVLAPVASAFAGEENADVSQGNATIDTVVEEKIEETSEKDDDDKEKELVEEKIDDEEDIEKEVEETAEGNGEDEENPDEQKVLESSLNESVELVTFAKSEIKETAEPQPVTGLIYDGKEHELCVPGQKADSIYQYKTNPFELWSNIIPKRKNAGTTTVYWREINQGREVGSGEFDVTIEKAKITDISINKDKADRVYNGHIQEIDKGDLVVVTDSGMTVPSNYIGLNGQTKGKNAGVYNFTANILPLYGDNFDTSVVLDASFKISKKELTRNMISADSLTFVANNMMQGPEFSVMDFNFMTNIITKNDYEISGTRTAKFLGTYTTTFTATETGNYIGSVDVDWDIVPKGVKAVPHAINRTYDGTFKDLITPGELEDWHKTMVYKLSTDLVATPYIPKARNAGTYIVEYGYYEDLNFKKIGEVKVSVDKADISTVDFIKEKAFVYNAEYQGYSKFDLNVMTSNGLKVPVNEFEIEDNVFVNAGEYTLQVTANKESENFTGSTSVNWSISKAPIEIADMPSADKIYDGNPIAYADAKDANLTGIYGRDQVVLTHVLELFHDKNAGENKQVTFVYVFAELEGDDADNYELKLDTAPRDGKATIAQKEIGDVEGITINEKVYDGTTDADVNPWLAKLPQLIEGDSVSIYDVKGRYANANAEADKQVQLDYSDAKLGGLDSGNYKFVKNENSQRFALGTIKAKELTADMIKIDGNFSWDGKLHFPTIQVSDVVNGKNIISNDDITYDVRERKDVGTYDLVINAKVGGNYIGEVETTWVIKPVGKFDYDIIQGDGSVYYKRSKDTITVAANGPVKKFRKLLIDGKEIDASNYRMDSGNAALAIYGEYLDTLKVGEHTFRFVYEDGVTNVGTIIVKSNHNHREKNQQQGKDYKKQSGVNTGDYTSSATWSATLIISAAAVGAGCLVALKLGKKKS